MKDGLQGLGVGYKYPGKLGSVDVGVQFGIHLDILVVLCCVVITSN